MGRCCWRACQQPRLLRQAAARLLTGLPECGLQRLRWLLHPLPSCKQATLSRRKHSRLQVEKTRQADHWCVGKMHETGTMGVT